MLRKYKELQKISGYTGRYRKIQRKIEKLRKIKENQDLHMVK